MLRVVWAVVALLSATEAGAYERCTAETSTNLDCLAMTSGLSTAADRPNPFWSEADGPFRVTVPPHRR
ncbi:hypothetical protein LBMAG56_53780 [Verrucomicrobiota bacterium]|nr:hypothetical protein LBMAG56_53780 [Verrucomicrobiota bacterium]